MATYRQTGPDGHYHEFTVPDGTPVEQVHALGAATLQARATLVPGLAFDPRRTPLPPRRLPLPKPLAAPVPMARLKPVTYEDPYLPEPDDPERWPNSLTAALHRYPDKLHGPPPDILTDPVPLHRPDYGDTTGLSQLPGTTFPGMYIRRPLLEQPVAARKRLRFDDPQLDAYGRVVEVRNGISPDLLVSIKNRGERSDSWAPADKYGSVGVMRLTRRNQDVYNRPGEDPSDPVASMNAWGRLYAREYAGLRGIPAQLAAHNGGGASARLVQQDLLPKSPVTARLMGRVLDDLEWKKIHEPAVYPDPPDLYDPSTVPYRRGTLFPPRK